MADLRARALELLDQLKALEVPDEPPVKDVNFPYISLLKNSVPEEWLDQNTQQVMERLGIPTKAYETMRRLLQEEVAYEAHLKLAEIFKKRVLNKAVKRDKNRSVKVGDIRILNWADIWVHWEAGVSPKDFKVSSRIKPQTLKRQLTKAMKQLEKSIRTGKNVDAAIKNAEEVLNKFERFMNPDKVIKAILDEKVLPQIHSTVTDPKIQKRGLRKFVRDAKRIKQSEEKIALAQQKLRDLQKELEEFDSLMAEMAQKYDGKFEWSGKYDFRVDDIIQFATWRAMEEFRLDRKRAKIIAYYMYHTYWRDFIVRKLIPSYYPDIAPDYESGMMRTNSYEEYYLGALTIRVYPQYHELIYSIELPHSLWPITEFRKILEYPGWDPEKAWWPRRIVQSFKGASDIDKFKREVSGLLHTWKRFLLSLKNEVYPITRISDPIMILDLYNEFVNSAIEDLRRSGYWKTLAKL